MTQGVIDKLREFFSTQLATLGIYNTEISKKYEKE